jgi:gluconolactonase
MTSDLDGRLVVCEQGDHDHPACISRIDPATGERIVVVSEWRGRRLNSPNDVVTAADGAIWFTDPTYGHLQGFRPAPELGAFVYRWDPVTGTVDVVADGFDQPKGIALAPDGSTLYATDSGANQAAGSFHVDRPHHVVAFEVVAGRRLAGRRLLAVTAPGFPDGLKVDAAGRVYVSASSGVLVYPPDGDLLGEIWVPGAVNFTFGGADRDVLFITADTAVWAARLAATGPVAVPARAVPSHPHPVRSPVMTRPTRTRLSLDGASVEAVATAAEKYATERGHRVVIAVVDAGGNLLHLRHTAGAQVASSRVAVDKARTAAIFVRPSRDLEAQVSSGRFGALALHGAAALTGGVPLVVDGQVVGAIGTSGETPDEDEAVSLAGAAVALPRIEIAALTFAGARLAAEAAGAGSARRGVAPVVAVVDAGGELVYVHRPDAAQVASVGVATDKARTAAIYRRPSKDFEDQASGGRPSALHLHGAVPLQGGIPLVVDGTVVGAIGVSGASSADEDQELALLGAEAFDVAVAVVPRATRVDAAAMDDGFAVGRLVSRPTATRSTPPGAPAPARQRSTSR